MVGSNLDIGKQEQAHGNLLGIFACSCMHRDSEAEMGSTNRSLLHWHIYWTQYRSHFSVHMGYR